MSGYGSSDDDTGLWISRFCSAYGHDFFCAVPPDFIEDDFNLTGLAAMVPHYRDALDIILDVQDSPDALLSQSAEVLYGLIHARFIATKQGLHLMAEKFEQNVFGSCPRHLCHGFHMLPLGRVDVIGVETVRLYCANCNDVYLPASSKYLNLDGAFFGSSFAGLFVKMFPQVGGQCHRNGATENGDYHEPFQLKLFGFHLNDRAVAGPRMKWLRDFPHDTTTNS